MRAVLLDPPHSFLRQRHEQGADRWDEVWEGVLHMVPPPASAHQRFGTKLVSVLAPIAEAVGLVASYETGVFRPGREDDYRVPDIVIARPEDISERGVEGTAQLVVEILSSGDESREKLPFYASVGVAEILLVHPATRQHELHILRAGALHLVVASPAGTVHSDVLGVAFSLVEGPRLALAWRGHRAEI